MRSSNNLETEPFCLLHQKQNNYKTTQMEAGQPNNVGANWPQDQLDFMKKQLADAPFDYNQHLTIFRLPTWYHESNKHLYVPKMVAIGPYHHGKESLQTMEEHKWCSLQNFLNSNQNIALERYLSEVAALEAEARHCYSVSVSMQSHDFVMMLLLDACFIIDYFEKAKKLKSGEQVDTISHVGWAKIHLYSDLFQMENQIPFFVIHKLITIRDGDCDHNKNSCSLLELFCQPLERIFSTTQLTQPKMACDEIHHLLQLYYTSMVPDPKDVSLQVEHDGCNAAIEYDHDGGNKISSASELREASIIFKKKQNPHSMFDISFKNGIMEMPFLKLEKTHKVILWNMAAFEQSQLPYFKPQILSSYLALMDSLINTEKDVSILERSGVIENYLQTDEDAAELFNQFSKSFTLDYSDHYYRKLFQEVKKYSNMAWHKNMAQLNHDYFRNPWTTISVLAAAILLILTALQTYFSAKSAN